MLDLKKKIRKLREWDCKWQVKLMVDEAVRAVWLFNIKNCRSPQTHTKNDQIRNNLLTLMPSNLLSSARATASQTLNSNKKDSNRLPIPLISNPSAPQVHGKFSPRRARVCIFSCQTPARPSFPLWEKSTVKATFLKFQCLQRYNKRPYFHEHIHIGKQPSAFPKRRALP